MKTANVLTRKFSESQAQAVQKQDCQHQFLPSSKRKILKSVREKNVGEHVIIEKYAPG